AEVVLFAIGLDTTDQSDLARRVRQSEKLAAVGTLAAGLAHEIRNPLNGAALHVTFLERGLKRSGADEETRGAVKVVGDEIKRLSALVSEFLDFARPQPLQKKAVSIRTLCERAAQIMAPDAARANIEVKLDLPVADQTLDLDPRKMEQVLLNLLRNAIEAQEPAGSGTVTVRVRRQPRQEVIEIEDAGPGLSDPQAPIFDPFFSTKPAGTGLGLAIVHRIVTDHDGAIDVHSHAGKTIFRITLPIRLTAA
ncbi:MAG TPA: ATP-binding protein, partial [Polyangiaceae bacterium]|nr:ATP-binding protein [Polyangiaceae bacterium]